ncbi:collagen alpha-1(I) chain-like [Lethenteron reissneri]|uniref:collagen alpha-1(I) chain-like n=1 Tax=Lethenteron reissneri TaxID=7753 RepID=UPI002AB69985|nr:collagen alpha-1(I) chain-like [Lethenteron reissneri]
MTTTTTKKGVKVAPAATPMLGPTQPCTRARVSNLANPRPAAAAASCGAAPPPASPAPVPGARGGQGHAALAAPTEGPPPSIPRGPRGAPFVATSQGPRHGNTSPGEGPRTGWGGEGGRGRGPPDQGDEGVPLGSGHRQSPPDAHVGAAQGTEQERGELADNSSRSCC